MTKCFLSTHLDPRQQVVLSHWLPCVVLPRYLALSSLLSFACFCRSSNFIPSEKRRGRIKCLVLVKHSEIATLLLPQLPHCLPTKALLDSDKERQRQSDSRVPGMREVIVWQRLRSHLQQYKALEAAETGNIHTLRLTAESPEDSQYGYNQLSATQLTFTRSEPLPALKDSQFILLY